MPLVECGFRQGSGYWVPGAEVDLRRLGARPLRGGTPRDPVWYTRYRRQEAI